MQENVFTVRTRVTCLNVVEKGSGVLFGRTYHIPLLLARSYHEIDIMHFLYTCILFSLIPDYLLSNNHVNSIIVHKFDFSDEEVMAYYISFLKTLSFRLNKHTIHFFYNEVCISKGNQDMLKAFFWPTYVCDACQFKFVKLKSTFPIHGPFNSAPGEALVLERSTASRKWAICVIPHQG